MADLTQITGQVGFKIGTVLWCRCMRVEEKQAGKGEPGPGQINTD